jgi:hypothetical protein
MSSENTDVVTDLDASFFQAYSKKVKADSEKKNTTGSYKPREFEEVAFCGLETGVNKIYRIIGAPPGSETMGYQRKNYDPRHINIADVKDDEGKRFNIRLPLREDTPAHNHIMHRLYDKVAETAWINKKKVFINEAKFPDLWKMLTKGNFKEEDGKSFSIAAGFKSTTFTMLNVIDREDDWCEKNNHTKILCNNLTVSTNPKTGEPTVWANPGIKSYSLDRRLADLIGKYGNFETYDVSVKKTGDKDNPLELRNASLYKSKDMMEELKNADGSLPDEIKIVVGALTASEKAYKRYDLDKLYQATSYTKLLKRIPALFKLTDAYLGTKFYEELEALSEKEKEEWKRIYGDESAGAETEQIKAETAAINEAVAETPKRRPAVGPVENLSDAKIALLKGWAKLSDHQRSLIKDIKANGNVVEDIVWEECDETKNLFACDCQVAAPESYDICPACGASFI